MKTPSIRKSSLRFLVSGALAAIASAAQERMTNAAALAAELSDFRFHPALDHGKPVAGVIRLQLVTTP